jgi:hypothetical protein
MAQIWENRAKQGPSPFEQELTDFVEVIGQMSYDGKTPLDFTISLLLSTFWLTKMAN